MEGAQVFLDLRFHLRQHEQVVVVELLAQALLGLHEVVVWTGQGGKVLVWMA